MNCACHGQITLNELVAQINNLLGKENLPRSFDATQDDSGVKPIYAKPRHGDIKHSFADINLIKKNLNFEPRVSFTEGLKKTINAFR